MNTKKILIVTSEFPPQPGGIGSHAFNLALNLTKHNFVVSIIADQRSNDRTIERNFDACQPFHITRVLLKRIRLFMYFDRILKSINGFRQTDYVIATGKFSLWIVAFCSFFFKRPKMAIVHGSEVNFKSKVLSTTINLSLKRFNAIVAVSNYTKHLVAHLKREVHVIPNGIDMNQWRPENFSKVVLEGKPILLTVGRVSARKGQLQVIKLLPALQKKFPEIHYHCIGIPTEAEDFMRKAKLLGVDNAVTFHGSLEVKDLKNLLLTSDVFIMLSTETKKGDVEGFGIAILEANAMGIPSIGSIGCGIEDAIKHGFSGFLVDPYDAGALTAAITNVLLNSKEIEHHAMAWAEKHDWRVIINRYILLFP